MVRRMQRQRWWFVRCSFLEKRWSFQHLDANIMGTMLDDRQILRYNPWWARDGWEADDPHLRRLREQPARLPSPQVEDVDLARPAVHISRGPRQVGKSTDLKLLVRRALNTGFAANRIVYLSLDALEDRPTMELVDVFDRALQSAGPGSERPRLILLDEVTSARRWRTAIKIMWDDGRIDGDIVLCTGSSAIDLAEEAAERLPGRRGSGQDVLILPQDFGSCPRGGPGCATGPGAERRRHPHRGRDSRDRLRTCPPTGAAGRVRALSPLRGPAGGGRRGRGGPARAKRGGRAGDVGRPHQGDPAPRSERPRGPGSPGARDAFTRLEDELVEDR